MSRPHRDTEVDALRIDLDPDDDDERVAACDLGSELGEPVGGTWPWTRCEEARRGTSQP